MQKKQDIRKIITPPSNGGVKDGVNAVNTSSAHSTTLLHRNSHLYDEVATLLLAVRSNPAVPLPVKAVAYLLFESGLRISEALAITAADVLRGGFIRINAVKGSNSRVVKIAAFRSFWESGAGGCLPLAATYSRFYFYRWFKKIGLYKIMQGNTNKSVTHLFRHAIGCHFKSSLNDSHFAKYFLGHANINSTHFYERGEE